MEPFGPFLEPVVDVLASAVYLAGIAVIELVLRPLFGSRGVPLAANVVLTLGDITLVISLLKRLFGAAEDLWKTILESSIYESIQAWLRFRKPPAK